MAKITKTGLGIRLAGSMIWTALATSALFYEDHSKLRPNSPIVKIGSVLEKTFETEHVKFKAPTLISYGAFGTFGLFLLGASGYERLQKRRESIEEFERNRRYTLH